MPVGDQTMHRCAHIRAFMEYGWVWLRVGKQALCVLETEFLSNSPVLFICRMVYEYFTKNKGALPHHPPISREQPTKMRYHHHYKPLPPIPLQLGGSGARTH